MKKLTSEEYKNRCSIKYNFKYDYSEINYIDTKHEIIIICPIHDKFKMLAGTHLYNSGCHFCKIETSKLTCEEFIKRANNIYNFKYDYNEINYIDTQHDIIIGCPLHGKFKQKAYSHLAGHECPKCAGRNKTTEEYINECNQIHQFEFDYSQLIYKNSGQKVIVICKKHGIFLPTATDHLQGYGCPKCNESKGEKAIRKYLKISKIEFKSQYKINECKNIRSLPFDFAIFKENGLVGLIEYQGEQHFREAAFGSKTNDPKLNFLKIKHRDQIKLNYCQNHGIPLLIIPHWEKQNINEILLDFIKSINTQRNKNA